MAYIKKVFLDYGGLICDYQFNRKTLFRAHGLALGYINSQANHKIDLNNIIGAHDRAIQDYLKARDRDNSEWPMDKIMGLMLSNLGLNGSVDVSSVSEIYKLNDHDSVLFPENRYVLTELVKTRTLGIISNLPHDSLINELKVFGLLDLFETITISCQVGYRKPHPKIYQEALKRAHVKPSESMFISHDEEEIRGAERLGIESLLVKSLKEVMGVL